MDKYDSFRELAAAHRENVDYEIEWIDRETPLLIMAPHGGGIEPNTVAIAKAIAQTDHSLYCFKGKLQGGANRDLHITSHRFDEPQGAEAASRAERIITVHGAEGSDEWTMIGGLDTNTSSQIAQALRHAGFHVRQCRPDVRAVDSANICNRGRSGAGVQLEISDGLRKQLRANPNLMAAYASAVRASLVL